MTSPTPDLTFSFPQMDIFRTKISATSSEAQDGFAQLNAPIQQASNLAGLMQESQNAQRLNLGLLRGLEVFAGNVVSGLKAMGDAGGAVSARLRNTDDLHADDINQIFNPLHAAAAGPGQPSPVLPPLPPVD